MNADYVESREFTAVLEGNGLFKPVRTPTRARCAFSTLLDLFIICVTVDEITTGAIVYDISDHFRISSIILKERRSQHVSNVRRLVQVISEIALVRFRQYIW